MNKKDNSLLNLEKKFCNFVSLGYFCSVASELERIGLRTCSGPFDWQASRSFELRIKQVNDGFKEFFDGLNEQYLYQKQSEPQIYFHSLVDTFLVHDFNSYDTLSSQLPTVIQKYRRRVDSFYKHIQKPTLFIHYIYNAENATWIEKNYDYIIKTLKQYNSSNDIVFIANNDIQEIDIPHIYYVEPDKNDNVARTFLNKIPELEKVLNQMSGIGFKKRTLDRIFYYRTRLRKKWARIKNSNKTQESHYCHSKIHKEG